MLVKWCFGKSFPCILTINNITYASPEEANAENDSRLLRPNRVCGTRDIVTTECRRPDDVDAYLSAAPTHKKEQKQQ